MNTNLLIYKLSTKRNGQFFKMSWCTDVKLTSKAASEGHVVLKYTVSTVRKGIRYGNMKKVKEKVQNNPNYVQTHELSWGSWKPGYEGLIIEHTNKEGKYKEYVRLYSTPNKPKTYYLLDNKPISKENLMATGYVRPSYWNSTEPSECYTISIANIQSIW